MERVFVGQHLDHKCDSGDQCEGFVARRGVSTCFALLFLKRATAKLVPKPVPTEDSRKK